MPRVSAWSRRTPPPDDEPVDVVALIVEVAERHQPPGGYGATAWLPKDGIVLWVCGDETSDEEVDAAAADFLDIDQVREVRHEREDMPEGWASAEIVYGGDRDTEADVEADVDAEALAAQARVDELVTAPLELEDDLLASLRDQFTPSAPVTDAAMERALEVLAQSHQQTVAAVAALTASAAARAEERQSDQFTHRALDILQAFAARPAPAPPNVEVRPTHVTVERQTPDLHMHAAPVTVHPPNVEVTVPDREVIVNVPEQAPPQVTVEAAAPQPVHVHVPPQAPAAVHVNVPPAPPRAVRVEYDDDGNKVYVQEDME